MKVLTNRRSSELMGTNSSIPFVRNVYLFTFIFLLSLFLLGSISASTYSDCSVYGTCNKGSGTTYTNTTNIYNNYTNITQTANLSGYVPYTGATGNIDLGNFYFKNTIATGTAPYQCTSTTLNTNLNADLLDGKHNTDFIASDNANFTTLTNDSMVDSLHRHSELSASDGSPNPALSVDASGNVGIGTAAPGSLLEVAGNVLLKKSIADSDLTVDLQNDAQKWQIGLFGSGSDEFRITDTTAGKGIIKIFPGSNAQTILMQAGEYYVNYLAQDVDFIIKGDNDANLFHTDAGNDRIGIGTAAPYGKLQITQSLAHETLGQGALIITGRTYPNSGWEFRIPDNGLGGDLYLDREFGGWQEAVMSWDRQTGNVGIGTTSPSALLHGIKTTEQFRIGYNTSNYKSETISSTGTCTTALTGTSPINDFSQAVKFSGGTQSSDGSAGISVTIVTAQLTALGSQGSMTFKNGLLTAQTPAT